MSETTARYTPVQKVLLYALLIAVSVVVLFPIWQAFVTSMATDPEVATWPPRLFPSHFDLKNYQDALATAPLFRYVLNSIIQSSTVTLSHLILACLAAYAFAFIEFPLKNFFFMLFMATQMIPWEAIIIPNYLTIVQDLRFGDTYQGLALPYLATAFGTFLVRQFFLSIPRDLHDAAVMDGCGRLRFLITIAVPLARPALGTLAVFSFLQTYNQYLWPLLITNNVDMRTAQIGIALLQDQEDLHFNIEMAGAVFILIPTFVLFILGNRQLIRGLTAGAVKG